MNDHLVKDFDEFITDTTRSQNTQIREQQSNELRRCVVHSRVTNIYTKWIQEHRNG
jgi:hypothetical protein